MSGPREARPHLALLAGLIAATAIIAYANSLAVPFLFDDQPSILQNPTIRNLGALGQVLAPPALNGATTGGRPLLNLSFAINYALTGTRVGSYHAANLLIHLLAGLALFGLARRTLRRLQWAEATGLAAVIALLWTLHPLQVESVTYIAQRAESLAGLFFLLTFYGFVRGADAEAATGSAGPWFALAAGACLAGMATKETMVTVPVLVFLYDRTFVGGSFREAWRRHRWLHLGLAATWLLLAALVAETGGNRGGSIGFGVGVPWWKYALSQFRAIVLYLRLSLWPRPLIFDYGTQWTQGAADVLPYAVIVLALLGATLWALRRRPVLGFLGAWFFVILAPTSSVVPGIRQTAAEHRMYLPLAALVALVVCAVAHRIASLRRARVIGAALATLAVVAALAGTLVRNHAYRSERAIWTDTTEKLPTNGYARYNLGVVLFQEGNLPAAIAEYRAALRIEPGYPEAHNNLGIALSGLGRTDEAIAEYREAIRLHPRFAQAHNNLGNVLAQEGQVPEGIAELREALRLQPDYPDAELNLGIALEQVGQVTDAVVRYQEVLRRRPEYADAHDDLGNALIELHRLPEAMEQFRAALRLNPQDAEAYNSLGNALIEARQLPEAIANFQTALRLRPAYVEARRNLGDALAESGRFDEAIRQYGEALKLRPNYAGAHASLANALVRSQRLTEAIAEYRQALRLAPGDAATHNNLGGALAQLGRLSEAGYEFEAALRLRPDFADARRNLERLRSLSPSSGP